MNFLQRLLSIKHNDLSGGADQNGDNSQASFSAAVITIENFTTKKEAGKNVFEMRWLAPDENPFRQQVFDCREYAFNRIATTKNAAIATAFKESRVSDGIEFIGRFPDNAAKIEVSYNFNSTAHPAFRDGIPDGILFKAKTMEEKWDIYKYSQFLFL